jgi:hypothetical protein
MIPLGECTSGTAATFEDARAAFLAAWAAFLSKRTEADFEECREERDWTTWPRSDRVLAR